VAAWRTGPLQHRVCQRLPKRTPSRRTASASCGGSGFLDSRIS
jgi:hypothetical protein